MRSLLPLSINDDNTSENDAEFVGYRKILTKREKIVGFCQSFLLFLVGMICGIAIGAILMPPKAGGKPKLGFNLLIYISGNLCLHIHHWMYLFPFVVYTIILCFVSGGYFTRIVGLGTGFLVGLSMLDFRYADWDIVKTPCHL